MRSMTIRALVLVVAPMLTGACSLAAQGANPGDIKHRNDCRLAEQVLTQGQPANKRAWALEIIGSCSEGPAVLLGLWNNPPADEAEIRALYHGSIQSGNEQVFDAAFVVVQNTSASATLRLAALGTVVTMVRPELVLYFDAIKPLTGMPPLEWDNMWGTLDHPTSGAQPPQGGIALVHQVVQDLSVSTGDSLVRDAAWWLTQLHDFSP